MRDIKVNLVTDEKRHPVAVQIDYGDWLEIKRLLGIEESNPRIMDPQKHAGTVTMTEDPLEFQARMRAEWE